MFKNLFFAFSVIIFTNCQGQGQTQRPVDPPLPLEKFKKIAFEPPAPDILATLKIPFLDGELYGIADAAGKILLAPQFEDAEMTEWDLPFLKAKKNGAWSVYGLDGRQVLPISADIPQNLLFNWERLGARFDEKGLHIEQLISKIRETQRSVFIDPSGATVEAFRYFFLTPKTNPPYRSWFMPDHGFFIRSNRDRWNMGSFTSDFQHENLKIMDEKGRFGLLDRDGNLLQPPVRNCATIVNADKIVILDDRNLVALRDVKKGWQTDFLFNNVEPTSDPAIFLGSFLQQGQPTRFFKIDGAGVVTPIEKELAVELQKNVSYSTRPRHFQILWDTARAVLIDLRTGKELYRIEHGRIGAADLALFEVEKDKKRGWLDSTGRLLLPVEYDKLIPIWQDRRLIAIKNGLAGLFDVDTGREILPVQFPYLNRGAFTQGRGVGFQIRSGKDWVYLTKNLEIVGQKGPNAPVKTSDFILPENISAAARADFETAVLPEFFNSVIPIKGQNWLHLFRCNGPHIASIETGGGYFQPVYFLRSEHFLDEGNSFYSGFVRVQPGRGKAFYVRLSDGKIFKK